MDSNLRVELNETTKEVKWKSTTFSPKKIKSPLSHFWGSLFCSFVEVLLFHILQHPFIIFDFLSGISTLVTLVMWYLALFVVFSFLGNNYWIYCLP